MNFKNFKIVRTLKNMSFSKLKWAMYNKLQEYKIASRYIDYLIPERKDINTDNEKLEKMVRDTLLKEFSPKIKNMKSFDLLVDATVHNIKLKQMKEMGDWEDIEV